MKNRHQFIALIAGIAFGGLAFYLLYQKASELEQRTTPIQVLVASQYIPAGSLLKADMVEKRSVPESFVSPGTIRDLRDVEGLMSLTAISAGEPILSNKFGEGEETLALTLNPGYRAYSLEVSETAGVGGLLRPGNHVDLLTKFETNKRETTAFVFQDLQVLAVGQKLGGSSRTKKDQAGGPTDGGYSHVTLAVTPEQAETLMYLEGRALKLVLRPPHDEDIVSVPSQSEAEVMAKLGHFTPKAGRHIEIIRSHSEQGDQ